MSRLAHQTVRSDQFNNVNSREMFLKRLRDCDVLRALVNLVPAYDRLIRSTDSIPEGLAGNVQKILYPAIAHVLTETRKFCHLPIVLFFDDVQWIDPGSKGILAFLLANRIPVLIIVAFRDESSHSLFTLESLLSEEKSCLKRLDVSLQDLNEKNVNEMIHSLALADEDKDVLSEKLFKQTHGNPFFLRFRLSMMGATGALTYDIESHLWRLDQDRLDLSTEVTAEDVIDYCVSVLSTLDREVSTVLCRLAMMPQGWMIDEYVSVLEHEKGVAALAKLKSCKVAELLEKAVLAGVEKNLLIRSEKGFRFAHDRLQQSAIQFANETESCEIHYHLGNYFLSTLDSTPGQKFQVLDHFSKCKELITESDLILRIGKIMADICGFYITAGSHEHLDGMLQFTRDLLETIDEHHISARVLEQLTSLRVRLLIAHHEIKFLMNDLDAAGILFDAVRPHLKSTKDIRDSYHTRISLLVNAGSHHEAIEATAEALSRLDDFSLPQGLVLPDGQPAAIVGEVTKQIKCLMEENRDRDLTSVANSLAVSTDDDHNFRVELMISVIASMYLMGRFDLYIYVPAVACKRILENGVTRSAGNAFTVLGFALVAIFGDSFGAEVAMFGKHLVDRFDSQVTICRAYSLAGIAIIYDERYEQLASRTLYASYVAGRNAHDILWSLYAAYLLGTMLVFEGVELSAMLSTLQDPFVYAMSTGEQAVAQRGLRSVIHMLSILMGTNSSEETVVYHFSIPSDEITQSEPLVGFTHATISLVSLFFDQKMEIAWQIISESLENGLAASAPGLPVSYIFHLYTVVVAHGLLVKAETAECSPDEHGHLLEEECEQLRTQMKSSAEELGRLKQMARIFEPSSSIADACILDVVEHKPLVALQQFESVADYLKKERAGKNYDLIVITQLISAGISKRLKLESVHNMYTAMARATLKKWGAHGVVKHLAKVATRIGGTESDGDTPSSLPHDSLSTPPASVAADGYLDASVPSAVRFKGRNSLSELVHRRHGPDFASVLTSAGYITSFSNFEELTTRLCTTLMKQATASRLLLLVRDQKSGELELTAECTRDGMSPPESMRTVRYSSPIVRVTEQLQESVIVHSAQQESPYCFESYILQSRVCSIASLPITYRGSLIACVYMEHAFRQGVFREEIIEPIALLGHHCASAIVNALLLRDVRKQTAQLEQSHTVLAKALKVKDAVLSNTSHELRSPLTGIIGLNEFILASDETLDLEVQNCMKTTLAMAKQLLHLVSDILDMSKIEEGALQLNYETTSLYSLIKEILDVAAFTSDRVHLINNVSSNFPEIIVDPARLKQIIFNLTSNAIKFTPEGSVTIASEVLDDEQTFVVSVADNGIGIDPSHLDIIFEQFGQVEAYETREFQGTGLGLSITKRLVNLHGGRIDVVSTVGQGTTFQVFIPMKPPSVLNGERNDSSTITPLFSIESSNGDETKLDANNENTASSFSIASSRQPPALNGIIHAHQGPALSAIPSDEEGVILETITENDCHVGGDSHTPTQKTADTLDDMPLRVLAVDDIPINLKVLSNFLIKDGHEVTTASNGKMLLELLSGDKWINYDIVLLDWMMPIMDGISACRLLRDRIPSELLPVMFLTAKSEPADMTKGFEAGGTDFATKPFNRHEIMARTRAQAKICRRSRSRYLDSVPVALKLLTRGPYWKMQSSVRTMPMFVICVYSSSPPGHGRPLGIDGPTLLHFFRAQQMVSDSEWAFCEVDDRSVSFVAVSTTLQQVRIFLRAALANTNWIESQVAKSTMGEVMHYKPLITVGIDYRPVTAHLLADQLPMLAAVESPVAHARHFARSGTKHEEVVLSESAKAILEV